MGYVFPATMTEQISNIKDMEISYRVLHPTMQLTDKQSGRTIEVPFMSLINKYKDFLSKAIDEVKLNDKLKIKYQYNPKAVSHRFFPIRIFHMIVPSQMHHINLWTISQPAYYSLLFSAFISHEAHSYFRVTFKFYSHFGVNRRN